MTIGSLIHHLVSTFAEAENPAYGTYHTERNGIRCFGST